MEDLQAIYTRYQKSTEHKLAANIVSRHKSALQMKVVHFQTWLMVIDELLQESQEKNLPLLSLADSRPMQVKFFKKIEERRWRTTKEVTMRFRVGGAL